MAVPGKAWSGMNIGQLRIAKSEAKHSEFTYFCEQFLVTEAPLSIPLCPGDQRWHPWQSRSSAVLVSSADGCMPGDMFHCHVLHNIYTISTHYLHCRIWNIHSIYTISTLSLHYLHCRKYTISTHYLHLHSICIYTISILHNIHMIYTISTLHYITYTVSTVLLQNIDTMPHSTDLLLHPILKAKSW